MPNTKLLIGSLSNDLYRVACLTQRGSTKAAEKFWVQCNRWVKDLENAKVKPYIKKIILDVKSRLNSNSLNIESAEKYLMYSILLQNYCLRCKTENLE
jgi:hypothetical protein